MRRIVADSGPLIAFGRGGLFDLVRRIGGDVLVPAAVFSECTRDAAKPGAEALIRAREAGLLDVRPDADAAPRLGSLPALGAGELAAIALALDLDCPLLMDERLGRAVAARHGIRLIGSAGLLLAAKRRRLVAEVAPILDSWRSWGYVLAPALLESVLSRAGERPKGA